MMEQSRDVSALPIPAIPGRLDELQQTVQWVSRAIDGLEQVLSPVLRAAIPELDAIVDLPPGPSSVCSQQLIAIRALIEREARRVDQLRELVDL